jgi:hypothetical protein
MNQLIKLVTRVIISGKFYRKQIEKNYETQFSNQLDVEK